MPSRMQLNCRATSPAQDREGVPLDAQLRPAAPGHAHDAAADAHARWRDGRQGGAGHRLPAQRLREARRGSRLQPVRHHRRPDELHLAGRQRDRLAPRGREAARHRAHAALQVLRTILAELARIQRSPALRRRGGARPGRVHRVPLRLQPARSRSTTSCETRSRPAVPPELHARRRRAWST